MAPAKRSSICLGLLYLLFCFAKGFFCFHFKRPLAIFLFISCISNAICYGLFLFFCLLFNKIQKNSLLMHLKGQHNYFFCFYFWRVTFFVWIIEYLSLSYNLTLLQITTNAYNYFVVALFFLYEICFGFNDTIHFFLLAHSIIDLYLYASWDTF